MSNVLRILVAFAVFSAGAGYSQTAVKYVNKCEYSIQINEGNQVLTLLEGRVSGRIDTCHCFDIHYLDVCRIDEKNRILSTRELGRKSFKNSKGENCFLDNLTLGIGSDDCSGSCRWFSGISYKISCEEPASIPDKCGKSKNYASQVILENSRAECDSLGGKFDGGVYPQKSPDGTTEYCVSGTCSNLCDSAWHRNVVKEIKDSVCCGRMRLEPQTGNGKCTEPKAMDSTKIGVNFPEVKLGCSGTPAGGGVNYCEVPSSSSSSSFEEALSSSSYEDAESSSSGEGEGDSGSEVDCFADVGMAASNLHSKIRRCEQEGGVPDFSEYSGCVYGSCLPPSSSSSGEQSSSSEEQSSSGDGESGVCSDGTQFSQKSEADLYGDWVYIGTETYGYRKARMRISDLRGMYFDALGRMSEKMQGSRFYFLKNSPIIEEWDEPLQFKVYAKTIADSVFGEVQAFIKEDEENGLRRDSTFYISNGYWDVLEIKGDAEISLKNSLGITSKSIRDSEGKLQERTITDKEGNFIVYDKYIWKNGLLDKEISLEGTRTYHYGESPYTDTVRVEPSDKGHYFHRGYDGTAGAIPKKSDPRYKNFINDPYSFSEIGNLKSLNTLNRGYEFVESKNFLYDEIINGVSNSISYRNPSRTDSCVIKGYLVCPTEGDSINGGSDINLILEAQCVYDFCSAYEIYSNSRIWGGMWLQQSTLHKSILHNRDYTRRCRTKGFLTETYYHEAKHFYNANRRQYLYEKIYIPIKKFESFDECEKNRKNAIDYIDKLWGLWKYSEFSHINHDSPSSMHTARKEVECNEIY